MHSVVIDNYLVALLKTTGLIMICMFVRVIPFAVQKETLKYGMFLKRNALRMTNL